jgi:serine/threonine protein kinase
MTARGEGPEGPLVEEEGEPAPVDVSAPDLHLEVGDTGELPAVDGPRPRYEPRGAIGQGGMGEVLRCRDRVVGRDVAMKLARTPFGYADEEVLDRFLREARVQAQLEHPAVVPVYDLGRRPDGVPYFTMKRIRGTSLATVLRRLREGDARTESRWSRRRLLTAFARVCEAVAYIHRSGVVHRDLKPGNVLFGEYGEVYLIDWGVAKVLDEPDEPPSQPWVVDDRIKESVEGQLLGTPAYMAPEQLAGAVHEHDGRADVYALGVILFEVLTLERAFAGRGVLERRLDAQRRDGLSPAAVDPACPPELDRLCREATRTERGDRIGDARYLAERVEAYLDGDRDEAARARVASRYADEARKALLRVQVGEDVEDQARTEAMRKVTSALSLDPNHPGALRTLVELLTEPPREAPPEAKASAEASFRRVRRLVGRLALYAFGGFLVGLPLVLLAGVRSGVAFGALAVALVGLFGITARAVRRGGLDGDAAPWPHILATTFAGATASVLFGPLIFVPLLSLATCLGFLTAYDRRRGAVVVGAVSMMALPLLGQAAGLLPATYAVENGHLVVMPWVADFPPLLLVGVLLAVHAAVVVGVGLFLMRLRKAYVRAELQMRMQKWQLEQLLPPPAQTQAKQSDRPEADHSERKQPTTS